MTESGAKPRVSSNGTNDAARNAAHVERLAKLAERGNAVPEFAELGDRGALSVLEALLADEPERHAASENLSEAHPAPGSLTAPVDDQETDPRPIERLRRDREERFGELLQPLICQIGARSSGGTGEPDRAEPG